MTYEEIKKEEHEEEEGEEESLFEKGEVGLGDEDEHDGKRDSPKGKGEVGRAACVAALLTASAFAVLPYISTYKSLIAFTFTFITLVARSTVPPFN